MIDRENMESWYSEEEELNSEEEIAKERIKEIENIYEYILDVKDSGIFPIFDNLTFEDLYEFLTGEELIKE
jgi:hypothetical protein